MLVLGVNNIDCSNLTYYWLLNDTGHVIDVIYIIEHGHGPEDVSSNMRESLLMSSQI